MTANLLIGCGAPSNDLGNPAPPSTESPDQPADGVANNDEVSVVPGALSSTAVIDGKVGGMKLPDAADRHDIDQQGTDGQGSNSSFRLPDQTVPSQTDHRPVPTSPPATKATRSQTDTSMVPSSTMQAPVQIASWQQIQSLAGQPGRVTVLDLWSLSCEPCMKEFPHLIEMQRAMADQVRCIAANLDFDGRKSRPPERYKKRVSDFLAQVQVGESRESYQIEAFICSTPNDEVYAAAKIVSLPAVLVFDQQGQSVGQFVDAGKTSGFTYEKDVIPFVESLLVQR